MRSRPGVVVDGFPVLESRPRLRGNSTTMMKITIFKNESDLYKRPIFRICVLYVDMMESMNRQLARGQKALAHNKKVRETERHASLLISPNNTSFTLKHKGR